MKPHQERVIEEQYELATKLEKLNTFIGGEIFDSLDQAEQQRLLGQANAMSIYLYFLNDRISHFA